MKFLLCLLMFLMFLYPNEIEFWDTQRKGANSFNERVDNLNEEYVKSAKSLGLEFVRLAYDKFKGEERDFILGNASNFTKINSSDFEKLKSKIELFNRYGIKVVISPLSIPGSRFVQNNGNVRDMRFYKDLKYHKQAVKFWGEFAKRLKDIDGVYGYNIVNEPHPEFKSDTNEQGTIREFKGWYESIKDTPKDIVLFYSKVIKEIRKYDKDTPIILDAGWYANPKAFTYWSKFEDDKVIYSFHMYEPYIFTSGMNFRKKLGYEYPGKIKYNGKKRYINKEFITSHIEPFFTWAKEEGIKSSRLMAGEFGCFRRNKGCDKYLKDVINELNSKGIHWAFYSFRESWDGYDYEVGTKGLGAKYWEYEKNGKNPKTPRKDNPLFDVIKKEFNTSYKP